MDRANLVAGIDLGCEMWLFLLLARGEHVSLPKGFDARRNEKFKTQE